MAGLVANGGQRGRLAEEPGSVEREEEVDLDLWVVGGLPRSGPRQFQGRREVAERQVDESVLAPGDAQGLLAKP